MQKYFIGYALTGQDKISVDRLREKIAEKFHVYRALNSPPHITLFYPFETTDPSPILQGLTASAHTISPFTIPVTGFGSFDESVWFLDPAQDHQLAALKEKIATVMQDTVGISEKKTWNGIHFHITLAFKDVTPEIHAQIGEYLKNEPLPLTSVQIDAVTLFQLKADGKWEAMISFPFSG